MRFSHSTRTKILFLSESLLIFVAASIAATIKFLQHYTRIPFSNYYQIVFPNIVIIMLTLQICFYYNGLYNLKVIRKLKELTFRIIQSFGVAAIMLSVIYLLFRHYLFLERGLFFGTIFYTIVLVFPWRYIYGWILKRRRFTENLLIVGGTPLADEISKEILETQYSGYNIIALVEDGKNIIKKEAMSFPVINRIDNLDDLIKEKNVDVIVNALSDDKNPLIRTKIESWRKKFGRLRIEEGTLLYEKLAGKVFIDVITDPTHSYRFNYEPPVIQKYFKRITDIVVSFTGLLLSLPIAIVTALLIKVSSKGPVFYVQERVGQHGKVFKLLKFRSMRHGAEKHTGPVWTEPGDERVTFIGRIIRKLRIDEIPQMINVLKGDMSFVGPRPERPFFTRQLEKAIPLYNTRYAVRPGITGLAQIKYSYGSSIQDSIHKLQYDLYYMKHMSLTLDLIIFFDTVKIVMFGTGAR